MTQEFGLMNLSCLPGPDGYCAVCSDEGILARVVAVHRERSLATVEVNEGWREIAIDLLDEVKIGDVVLVHLGFALARLEQTA